MQKTKTGLRTVMAVSLCKLARRFLHLTGRGGTTLPGRIALALDRDILARASAGMHVVLVTGTNGKTTTCRMLEKAILLEGKTCLLNRSGANLLPGITAEFACHTDWQGRPLADYAVIECDEGALKLVTRRIRPEAIVVTNLFRDQLDRYGEVMNTREAIRAGLRFSPESILCLNADCPLTATIADGLPNPKVTYGMNVPAGDQAKRELSDAKYCVRCGAELTYRYYTCAHLGSYVCPACGLSRPEPEIAVTELEESGAAFSQVKLKTENRVRSVRISLPAVYNVYNALGAVCAGTVLGIRRDQLLKAVRAVKAPFGRMETFALEGSHVQLILMKNPAGADQAMEYITGTAEEYGIAFCLNDRTADGHDISWIWDADFEKILADPKRKSIWVSGSRAEDMQLRLKYGGAKEEEIHLEKDSAALIEKMTAKEARIFALPNYTAMLDFRQALLKKTGGSNFWEG